MKKATTQCLDTELYLIQVLLILRYRNSVEA